MICAGTGCLAGGSGEIYKKMCELVKGYPDVSVEFGPEIAHGNGPVAVKKSGCHGFCEMGPLMRIEPMGILYTKVSVRTVRPSLSGRSKREMSSGICCINRMALSIRSRRIFHFIRSRPVWC